MSPVTSIMVRSWSRSSTSSSPSSSSSWCVAIKGVGRQSAEDASSSNSRLLNSSSSSNMTSSTPSSSLSSSSSSPWSSSSSPSWAWSSPHVWQLAIQFNVYSSRFWPSAFARHPGYLVIRGLYQKCPKFHKISVVQTLKKYHVFRYWWPFYHQFLATLVALHFTPVSKSVAGS